MGIAILSAAGVPGLIDIQSGTVTTSGVGAISVTFARPFASTPKIILTVNNNTATHFWTPIVDSKSAVGFTGVLRYHTGSGNTNSTHTHTIPIQNSLAGDVLNDISGALAHNAPAVDVTTSVESATHTHTETYAGGNAINVDWIAILTV